MINKILDAATLINAGEKALVSERELKILTNWYGEWGTILLFEQCESMYFVWRLITTPLPKPKTSTMNPHKCPVCNGNGIVPNGFYNQTSGNYSTSSIEPEQCRSCTGKGVIWETKEELVEKEVGFQDKDGTVHLYQDKADHYKKMESDLIKKLEDQLAEDDPKPKLKNYSQKEYTNIHNAIKWLIDNDWIKLLPQASKQLTDTYMNETIV